jgi:hypothetical protein
MHAPGSTARPPRRPSSSASGLFIALPSPVFMSQPRINVDMSRPLRAEVLVCVPRLASESLKRAKLRIRRNHDLGEKPAVAGIDVLIFI